MDAAVSWSLGVGAGWRWVGRQMTANGRVGSVLKWTVLAAHVCEYTKKPWAELSKWVNCMVCELHL